jgi:hypothetical protein
MFQAHAAIHSPAYSLFEAEILRKRVLTEINKQINFEELDNDQKLKYLILASDTSICHIIGVFSLKKH